MDKKTIVFDFDKTLTYKDTLFGFFLSASERTFVFPFKVFSYFAYMLMTKLGLITNDTLKKCGIRLFLRNKSADQMKKASGLYSKNIKLNELYKQYDFNSGHRIFIVSASFTEYLKPIFQKNITIIGSELEYSNTLVKGLLINCYKERKVHALKQKGIREIDELYTDSHSDYPLVAISKKIFIVKGDIVLECDTPNEFKAYFNK